MWLSRKRGRALIDGEATDVEGAAELMFDLAESEQVHRCMAGHLLSYAQGKIADSMTRYRNLETGEMMEAYHKISHRLGSGGTADEAALEHHYVDRQMARVFRRLLQELSAYEFESGTLLDHGVAIWHNDLARGPDHKYTGVPFIIAGSAGGYFKQGEMIELDGGDQGTINHLRVLNAIATATGLRTEGQEHCEDHGDENLERTPHPELSAS